MDSKQRKKLCKYYIGSSTAEMSMQLSHTQLYDDHNNFADRDLYFNTLRYDYDMPGSLSSWNIDVPRVLELRQH